MVVRGIMDFKWMALALLVPWMMAAGHWPQFRGNQANGVDPSSALPTKWNVESGENISWKCPIPGMAHASPIAWDDQIYLATVTSPADAELKVGLYGNIESAEDSGIHQWRLIAVNARTGEVEWNALGHEGLPKVKRHTKASHCNSTPATDGKRIAAIFGSEGLFCFGLDGRLLWKADLGPMDSGYFQVKSAQWGFASSPVIHDNRIVVLCDVQEGSYVAAFDAQDGTRIWQTPRNDVPTWGTPTIVPQEEGTQILINGWHHSGGYHFETGKEIWRHDGGGDIPVPTPIFADGLAIFTSAHGRYRPIQAIRLKARGDITAERLGETNEFIAWSHPRKGNYMQTPIMVDGLVFACFDNGVLTCLDARTGEIHYENRIHDGGEGFTASPVSDGRHVFFSSEQGNIYVVPVQREFFIQDMNSVGETVMASPAIAHGKLLIRTRSQLIAIGNSP